MRGSGAKPPEAESSVALEAQAEEPNLTLVTDSFSACHSITIASGVLMLWICRLDHLCVCLESVLWQNGSLDPDAIWGDEWGRAWYGRIRWWW